MVFSFDGILTKNNFHISYSIPQNLKATDNKWFYFCRFLSFHKKKNTQLIL